MITDEYVSFETAKLAKEKGFDVECRNKYERNILASRYEDVPAPTQSLLQRWLREEKRIDIAIVPLVSEGYSYIVYNILDRNNRVVGTNAGYKTYELALEDALKYALEKLV